MTLTEISGGNKNKNLRRRIGKQTRISEFFELSKTNSISFLKEELALRCVAHCKKCGRNTLAEGTRFFCRICHDPFVYHCALCEEQFLNLDLVKNHVIEESEQMLTSVKCTKCSRSDFSSQCSFLKHVQNCNSAFCFDKEVLVKLHRCDIMNEHSKGKIVYGIIIFFLFFHLQLGNLVCILRL